MTRPWRAWFAGLALSGALAVSAPAGAAGPAACCDWPAFGYTAQRSNEGPAQTGITAANLGALKRQKIALDGTVDSSPIYLRDVSVRGRMHDVIFVTTTYGRTEAIAAGTGRVLWRFTPPDYGSVAGSPQITTATPVADPGRGAIYAAAPDGVIRKLLVANGSVLWATSITRDPTHERLASALNYANGLVIITMGGYDGDYPSYQGKVVTLNPATGAIVGVWNALCSNRHTIIVPSTCSQSDAGIWGRSGAVVVPGTGDLLVATGNATFDGSTYWGDSLLLLSSDAGRLLAHWTPVDQEQLNNEDIDLGSTSPALLADGYVIQAGKDGLLRLLALDRLAGVNPRTGGELQTVQAPGGADVFTEPAVWQGDWVFLATGGGTAAWELQNGRLLAKWSNTVSGTSPVVAGGLLYVEGSGGIAVYAPASGRKLAELPIGNVHWQSPIVVNRMIVAAEGNSDDHLTSGILDIYRLG